jgi:hypothetical protein
LQRMKDKEEAEREKQLERKGKIIMQKQMRDVQLIEAKKRKELEAQVQRVKELELVDRLRQEINEEKETKINKRRVEREQALKVISDNENAKVKLMQEKEKERDAENKTIEEYNKMLELQEAKR